MSKRDLAAIEYHGRPHVTQSCVNAVVRLIHFGDRINTANLLTHSCFHGFLLEVNNGDFIAIKSGFSSGYSGEGSKGLANVLQLFEKHCVEIDEYLVNEELLDRLDYSCLQKADLDYIASSRPLRPHRYYDYVYDVEGTVIPNDERLRHCFPAVLSFAGIDPRLMDLAVRFDETPDASLFSAYRRLEGLIRERTGLTNEIGTRLLSSAFQGESSLLCWPHLDQAEQNGRASIFTGVFMAFRNRRAHKESKIDYEAAVREFMLINELYRMESDAKSRKIES